MFTFLFFLSTLLSWRQLKEIKSHLQLVDEVPKQASTVLFFRFFGVWALLLLIFAPVFGIFRVCRIFFRREGLGIGGVLHRWLDHLGVVRRRILINEVIVNRLILYLLPSRPLGLQKIVCAGTLGVEELKRGGCTLEVVEFDSGDQLLPIWEC